MGFKVVKQSGLSGVGSQKKISLVYGQSFPIFTLNGSGEYNLQNSSYIASTQGYYTLVPSFDFQARIQLWGAGGAGATGTSGNSYGGAGGYVEGIVSLLKNTTYVFLIGEGGYGTLYNYPANVTGNRSFPDGGRSLNNEGYGQGGGGGSSRFGLYAQSGFNITNSSANYNNTGASYFLIAGGGGGGTDYIYGWGGTAAGFGGGSSGSDGGAFYPSGESANATGKGGTQSAGGAAGTTSARLSFSEAGAKYYGGDGSGGAGGGGYYGGGGARGYYAMGGGGSGYIDSSKISSGLFYTATAGQSTHYISPNPRSDRPSTAGYGGQPVAGVRYSSIGGRGSDGAIKISLP